MSPTKPGSLHCKLPLCQLSLCDHWAVYPPSLFPRISGMNFKKRKLLKSKGFNDQPHNTFICQLTCRESAHLAWIWSGTEGLFLMSDFDNPQISSNQFLPTNQPLSNWLCCLVIPDYKSPSICLPFQPGDITNPAPFEMTSPCLPVTSGNAKQTPPHSVFLSLNQLWLFFNWEDVSCWNLPTNEVEILGALHGPAPQ